MITLLTLFEKLKASYDITLSDVYKVTEIFRKIQWKTSTTKSILSETVNFRPTPANLPKNIFTVGDFL